jgi:signal transduction histidine kinase
MPSDLDHSVFIPKIGQSAGVWRDSSHGVSRPAAATYTEAFTTSDEAIMTTLRDNTSDAHFQRDLARRFVWSSVWPVTLVFCVPIVLSCFAVRMFSLLFPVWPSNAWMVVAAFGVLGIWWLPVNAVIQARMQLAALRAAGIALSPERISASPAHEFVSPLDPIATFEICADRLSSIGMAAALGFARPAAFRHNPFNGHITIGRVQPFWAEGSVKVIVEQDGNGLTCVKVRRRPGLKHLQPRLGEGLAEVQKICADLERALKTRRASMDAALLAQSLERSALQSKLHVMQAQVEPHFLYNTLANLKYLIRTDQSLAQTMVDHLVGYLKAALPDMRTESSTVQRELELAEHYLSLMQIRMGDRLRFRIEPDPDSLDCPVPPAMLISLLENAVKHGLELATRPGAIVVSSTRAERCVELSVSDNGAGLRGEAAGDGLGLANIHQRLQLLYGAAAALQVAPGAHGGVLATLRIPVKDGA